MKEIKTVIKPYDHCQEFDNEINMLLADGWKLRKRAMRRIAGELSESFSAPAVYVLYAELDRLRLQFEEITL